MIFVKMSDNMGSSLAVILAEVRPLAVVYVNVVMKWLPKAAVFFRLTFDLCHGGSRAAAGPSIRVWVVLLNVFITFFMGQPAPPQGPEDGPGASL
ncbi:unnamed protein product [Lota lota]